MKKLLKPKKLKLKKLKIPKKERRIPRKKRNPVNKLFDIFNHAEINLLNIIDECLWIYN